MILGCCPAAATVTKTGPRKILVIERDGDFLLEGAQKKERRTNNRMSAPAADSDFLGVARFAQSVCLVALCVRSLMFPRVSFSWIHGHGLRKNDAI